MIETGKGIQLANAAEASTHKTSVAAKTRNRVVVPASNVERHVVRFSSKASCTVTRRRPVRSSS